MAQLLVLPIARVTDANGHPVNGAKLYPYLTNSTTPTPVYTTDALDTEHSHPVVTDAYGLLPAIYLDPSVTYRFVVKTSAGAAISGMDFDPVTGTTTGYFVADTSGGTDCTQAFQDKLDEGNVIVPPGDYTMSWSAMSSDVLIPGDRKIIVEKGATITMTGGRFTAENVDNVEWQIDGWVKSVAMRDAPTKVAWSTTALERGFIEFAGDFVPGTSVSGFKVHGSGIVSGDWTGTPNADDLFTVQTNRKGIACWNAANVSVEGLEVFGFDGEAVYGFFFDETCKNIVFGPKLHVHDTRFNALNFNAGENGGGCVICGNLAVNSYGIEASAGKVIDNTVDTTAESAIRFGVGAGFGPIVVARNIINNAGTHGIEGAFDAASPVTDITIEDNDINNPSQYGIFCSYLRELIIRGNHMSGIGQSHAVGAYDIGINHTLRAVISSNTFMNPGFGSQPGNIVVATSFDIAIDPDSNVYVPTTGTVPGYAGNGVTSIASAAAITLPPLGNVFYITGTTTITSIVATGNAGRQITLIFEGALTFTDGSDLKLAGDFVTTADDVIRLVCNGTNWFEISRSVN